MPVLVIVNGPPAAGKTTVAHQLSKEVALPMLSKDLIKESLFESLGVGDRDWSRKLGRASVMVMLSWMHSELGQDRSLIVEGPFRQEESEASFHDLGRQVDHHVVQIMCTCDPETREARLIERAERSLRHPGHLDAQLLSEVVGDVGADAHVPMSLGGDSFVLDCTYPSPDVHSVISALRRLLGTG